MTDLIEQLRGLSEAELERLTRGEGGEPSVEMAPPRLALAELRRRNLSVATRLALELAPDRRRTPELRLEAVRTLAKVASPASRQALVTALDDEDAEILRETVRALGRVGGPTELSALSRLNVRPGTGLGETVRVSERFIAFREGIDGYRLSPPSPSQIMETPTGDTRAIRSAPVDAETLAQAAVRLTTEVPAMELDLERALEINCLNETLLVLHSKEVMGGNGAERLMKAPAMPMVLMAYAHCTERYFLYGQILTQPGDAGLEIFTTRLRGQPTHYGMAKRDGAVMGFQVNALRTPQAPAALLSGRYDAAAGMLTLDQAVVSTATKTMLELRQKPKEDRDSRPVIGAT